MPLIKATELLRQVKKSGSVSSLPSEESSIPIAYCAFGCEIFEEGDKIAVKGVLYCTDCGLDMVPIIPRGVRRR